MRSSGPFRLLLFVLAGAGAWALASGSGTGGADRARPGPEERDLRPASDARSADCPEGAGPACSGRPSSGSAQPPSGPTLGPDEACRGAGYLCARLTEADTLRVMRYPDDTGVLAVRIPEPPDVDPARARRLHRAAIRGIQVWQGHPFPIRIEERRSQAPVDLEVRWVPRLEGFALGRTRSRFRTGPEGVDYRVVDLVLATRAPGGPGRAIAPKTVELAAAHELGHALGLPHSDDSRDLMYPENTATRPTPRDYRTLQAVYGIANGARIVGSR